MRPGTPEGDTWGTKKFFIVGKSSEVRLRSGPNGEILCQINRPLIFRQRAGDAVFRTEDIEGGHKNSEGGCRCVQAPRPGDAIWLDTVKTGPF